MAEGEDAARPMWAYRLGAFIVDIGIALVAGVSVEWIIDSPSDPRAGDPAANLTFLAVWLVATTGFMGFTRGRSVGMLLAGTRVLRDDGRPAGAGTSLL